MNRSFTLVRIFPPLHRLQYLSDFLSRIDLLHQLWKMFPVFFDLHRISVFICPGNLSVFCTENSFQIGLQVDLKAEIPDIFSVVRLFFHAYFLFHRPLKNNCRCQSRIPVLADLILPAIDQPLCDNIGIGKIPVLRNRRCKSCTRKPYKVFRIADPVSRPISPDIRISKHPDFFFRQNMAFFRKFCSKV